MKESCFWRWDFARTLIFEERNGMSIENKNEELLIEKAENYLKEYSVMRRLDEMQKYRLDYFGKSKNEIDIEGKMWDLPGSDAHIRMKMFEVRRFILSLGSCNEKVFLFYHYVHGETVARCGELMGISRRSAFRLKKRALAFAARKLEKYLENKQKGIR